MNRSLDTSPLTPPAAASTNKALWAVVAVLGATVLAMGGYLLRGPTRPVESGAGAVPALVVSPAAPVAATSTASPVLTEKNDGTPVTEKKPMAVVKPSPVASKSAHNSAQAHPAPTTPVVAGAPIAQAHQTPMPAPPAPKPLCLSCGTVISVTPVQHDGAGSGTGAIAGGVLGGILGNQVGGGDGKTIATILGALGGGYAGNTVEKKMKKETAYQIEVRMEDGSTRSFEQATHASVGAKVIVDGDSIRTAN